MPTESFKSLFMTSMEAMKCQYYHDRVMAEKLSRIYSGAEVPVYNNISLFKASIKLVSNLFDNPKEAEKRINSFVYEEEFGKHTGKTINDIYNELNG